MEENNTETSVDPMPTPNTKFPRRPEPQAKSSLFKQPAKSYYSLLKFMSSVKDSPYDLKTIVNRLAQGGGGPTKEALARAGMLESEPPNTQFPQNEEAQSLLEMVKRIQGE